MRNKLLAVLLCLGLLCPLFTARAEGAAHHYTVAEVESLSGGIVAYKEAACGASSVQNYIDTALCASAGTTAEFYVIALSQSGSCDFSRYAAALLAYLDKTEVYSATTREKYALALIASGHYDDYIRRVCDNDIGAQGLMSLVFGLHLLNNGYTSSLYSTSSLISAILSLRLGDGGWAVMGSSSDVDVTAMTIQALAPYYGSSGSVTAAVDDALTLLSARQLDSGGFKSMGTENCESAAQVLTALSALSIDQNSDSRFIKNDCTVLDAILTFRNADGSFAHTGGGFNESATTQAFYALRAYIRMLRGQSPLYIFDRRADAQSVPTERPAASTVRPTSAPPAPASATGQSTNTAPSVGGTSGVIDAQASTDPPASSPDPSSSDADSATGDQPTVASSHPADIDESGSSGRYKVFAVLAVLIAAATTCLILFLCKKRGFKHYLAVILIAAAAVAFLLLTNFESPESYANVGEKQNPVGSVTLSIRCTVLTDEDEKPADFPADGVILPETTFTLGEGESVYDILLEASKRYNTRIDNRGGAGSAYIAGIQSICEFDYGSLSGWMYRVNGVFPEVGCHSYTLKDGDRIEWLYTKEIGKDL